MSDSNVETQLMEILNEYQDELKEKVHEDFEFVGESTKEELRTVSKSTFNTKKGRKHYWSGWVYKIRGTGLETTLTVYNRTYPSLTHLLENGHQVYVGRKNTGKRARAFPHIEPAQKKATEMLIRKIKDDL